MSPGVRPQHHNHNLCEQRVELQPLRYGSNKAGDFTGHAAARVAAMDLFHACRAAAEVFRVRGCQGPPPAVAIVVVSGPPACEGLLQAPALWSPVGQHHNVHTQSTLVVGWQQQQQQLCYHASRVLCHLGND